MMDRHDDLQDLVAAYVLGAVDADEAALAEEHLATCAACRDLAGELREVEAALPSLAGERTPPPALKTRLMAIVEAEAATRPPGVQADPTPAQGDAPRGTTRPAAPLPLRPRAAGRAVPFYPLLAAAAVLVLAVAGFVVWRALSPSGEQPTREYAVGGTAAEPSITGELQYFKIGNRIVLDLHGLRPLAGGRVYEMWLVRTTRSGAVVSAQGVAAFRPDPNGNGTVTVTGYDMPSYNLAGLTVERSLATTPHLPMVVARPLG